MYKLLEEIKVPMTRNFTVDRPGQTNEVTQEFLDKFAIESIGREEKLIEHATKERNKFENDQAEKDSEDEIGGQQYFEDDSLNPGSLKDQVMRAASSTSVRKNSDDDDIVIPEKEELLWKDPDLDFQEYEEYIVFNG
jgi:hypothetical protein